jgi:hypothetical protein
MLTKEECISWRLKFCPDGYTYNKSRSCFIKKEKHREIALMILENPRLPGYTKVWGASVSIKFHDVENIVYKVSKIAPMSGQGATRFTSTIFHSPITTEVQTEAMRSFFPESIEQLETLDDHVNNLLNQCLVFVDNYPDIQTAYTYLEEKYLLFKADNYSIESMDPLSDFVVGARIGVTRIIMKKLLGIADWEPFIDELISDFSPTGESPDPEDYLFFNQLKTELLSMD